MRRSIASLILITGFTAIALATTIHVPEDQPTIQAGLNAAVEGDSVLVATGTYYENIVWPAVNGIKLIGSGEEDCIIDGDSLGSVIRFDEVYVDTSTVVSDFTIQNSYRPSYAVTRALTMRSRSRRNWHYTWEDFAIVGLLLRKKWSPEQIAGVLKIYDILSISHETIYKYVWWDKSQGGTLFKHLRQSGKKRRKRYRAYDSRGILAGKRHITERPEIIDNRARIGDWEIDTVMGSGDKHCIVTFVERKTGYTLIGKLRNRTKDELNRVTRKMIRTHEEKVLTITADNGTEFHGYSDLEYDTGVTFYFATPYHSWERGTNENTNGLIRQYLPKGKSMANLTQKICNKIAFELNTRPRKRHGFTSPWTMF